MTRFINNVTATLTVALSLTGIGAQSASAGGFVAGILRDVGIINEDAAPGQQQPQFGAFWLTGFGRAGGSPAVPGQVMRGRIRQPRVTPSGAFSSSGLSKRNFPSKGSSSSKTI